MCCFMEKMLASMLADFEMKVEKAVLEPLNKLSEVRATCCSLHVVGKINKRSSPSPTTADILHLSIPKHAQRGFINRKIFFIHLFFSKAGVRGVQNIWPQILVLKPSYNKGIVLPKLIYPPIFYSKLQCVDAGADDTFRVGKEFHLMPVH